MMLFTLPFLGTNIYRAIVRNADCEFGKDAVYNFLGSHRFSWRRLLLMVALKVSSMLGALTTKDRETVLILDDTSVHRPRAKKVELLARLYDHSENKFLKGFRMLTLAWSDGASLVPLDFALLSSANPCNRYQGIIKQLDRRTCGAKRRREAVTKSTSLLAPMVQRALETGIKARYLLMDSWFGMPAVIASLRHLLPVICMVKRTPKILYGWSGKRLSLDGIYRELKKRRGRAKILSSTVVTMNDGEVARIVFVRDRRKKDWLAILCTDINLSEEDVVRIYGKRWDIEVFFRTIKQFLELENGSQARDFDTLIAHSTIVFLRYIFLVLEQRREADPRSLGLLFHACCEEMRDVTYIESLKRIIELAAAEILPKHPATADIYNALAEAMIGQAIQFFGLTGSICQRSQANAA
ncbi:transposase [Solidesulfovibrio sp. C21]